MTEAAPIRDRMIGQVFSIGSETQRMDYLRVLRREFDMFLSLVLMDCSRSSTVVQTALDLVLRRKAINTEALTVQRHTALGGRYPKLASRLRELRILQAEIAQMTLAGPGP